MYNKNLSITKPIVLVGMMGSGKTYTAKILAAQLGIKSFDTDTLVEDYAGKTISKIFEEDGEEQFREYETIILKQCMLHDSPCVLATGGGIVLREENRDSIKKHAFTIWLAPSIDILLKRLKNDKNRPLLQGQDLETILSNLLEQRYQYYEEVSQPLEIEENEDVSVTIKNILQRIKTLSS